MLFNCRLYSGVYSNNFVRFFFGADWELHNQPDQFMMVTELIKIAIYSSNNSIFKPFDIHSNINSTILCSPFIHWNTMQYSRASITVSKNLFAT